MSSAVPLCLLQVLLRASSPLSLSQPLAPVVLALPTHNAVCFIDDLSLTSYSQNLQGLAPWCPGTVLLMQCDPEAG